MWTTMAMWGCVNDGELSDAVVAIIIYGSIQSYEMDEFMCCNDTELGPFNCAATFIEWPIKSNSMNYE